MEDYPRTLTEFEARFATDEACRAYLGQFRWPDGFVCPRCKGREGWAMSRGLWLCRRCRRQVSVTAGTVFQSTHLPLTLWFRAMWYVTSQKNRYGFLRRAADAKSLLDEAASPQDWLGAGVRGTSWRVFEEGLALVMVSGHVLAQQHR
jgi:ribosomal protein L37AE/L43A